MSDKDEKSGDNWISGALFGFVVIGILVFFWPSLIPFRFFEFWTTKGSLWDAVTSMWPLYVWGIVLNLIHFAYNGRPQGAPAEILIGGTIVSLLAGVTEEIAFRWLIFFSSIVLIPVTDWILLGFMGIHIVQWVYGWICWAANIATLGYLSAYLFHPWGWAVGAAMISSNGRFRNAHAYQGIVGIIDAWFFGMCMFWVLFNHGIIAAIITHFLFDFFIFLLVAISATGKSRKWA